MQSPVVVMVHKISNKPYRVGRCQRCVDPNTATLNRSMTAFRLAVALGIIWRGLHTRHAADPDKLLKIPGDKLRAIVGDNSRPGVGKFFPFNRPAFDSTRYTLEGLTATTIRMTVFKWPSAAI